MKGHATRLRRIAVRIPAMITAELRRLTATRMAVLALVALMTVPVLYGGLYLWANKDPYAALDRIPAAIVVTDVGTVTDGESVTFGRDVAEQLVEDGRFDWHIVDPDAALDGITEEDYDFVIEFPADFSEALASASTDDPHQARVTLTTSDVNSYLASTIGEQAADAIRTSIVTTVNEEAASEFLLGFADVRESLLEAADGAAQLGAGSADAADGAASLADGTDALATGAATLADGTSSLADGASALAEGTTSLADGASSLATGTATLAGGADDVADGAAEVAAGNAALAEQADAVGAAADEAAAAIPDALDELAAQMAGLGMTDAQIAAALEQVEPVLADLEDGRAALHDAIDDIDALADGAQQVADGAASVAAGASSAASGAGDLADGAASAADGAAELADGAGKVDSGASDLASGLDTAAAGASTLASGLGDLTDGADELESALADGAAQISPADEALRDLQAQTIADPVDLDSESLTSAGTYGAGLAPFFISLAAWIGMYALFLIVKPVSRRAITAIHSPVRVTLAGWLTPSALGAIQMVGLFAVVAVALDFSVDHPWGTYALMAVSAVTFAAIILALNVWLGSVGQFLGLVLMVLQLVTAGGTFPWQTLPTPLAALHHLLPMSYAVDGLRQMMYGGSVAAAIGDVAVLAAWLVAALVVAMAGVARMTHRQTLRDLQPSLIG